jgi:hypothetical protein
VQGQPIPFFSLNQASRYLGTYFGWVNDVVADSTGMKPLELGTVFWDMTADFVCCLMVKFFFGTAELGHCFLHEGILYCLGFSINLVVGFIGLVLRSGIGDLVERNWDASSSNGLVSLVALWGLMMDLRLQLLLLLCICFSVQITAAFIVAVGARGVVDGLLEELPEKLVDLDLAAMSAGGLLTI